MHRYRTHTCGDLALADAGETVRLSGWCHRIRDHGGVLFIDLRDHYGITQAWSIRIRRPSRKPRSCARNSSSGLTARAQAPRRHRESRHADRRGRALRPRDRGARPAGDLPMPVFGDQPYPEDTRLNTASSICGARSCTRTSCCAGGSSTRCARG